MEQLLNVGSRRQVFLDGRFIEHSGDVRIKVNPPMERREVLRAAGPWEKGCTGTYVTVLEDEGVYKMWYLAVRAGDPEGLSSGSAYSICYAVSKDGINWQRPELGLVEFEGNKKNNIVKMEGFPFFGGSPSERTVFPEGSVFLDPKAPPEQRLKMFVARPIGVIGVYLEYSHDGLNWRLYDKCLLPFTPDSQNQVIYDPNSDRYIAYIRTLARMRKVARIEIENLLEPWKYDPLRKPFMPKKDSKPGPGYQFPIVLGYDDIDPGETDIYNPCVFLYPWAQDAWYSFPSVFRHFPGPPYWWGTYGLDGLLDVQVATSRDGKHFYRSDRSSYIPLGIEGGDDAGMIFMGVGVLKKGDTLLQYYVGYAASHGATQFQDAGRIYVAIQRLDGFTCVSAPYTGGWFTTPSLLFSGGELELNADCGATGHIKVELQDEEGRAVSEFSAEECDIIRGNSIHKRVSWDGQRDISFLAGRPVRLHFKMQNARLFAFQFITGDRAK